MSKRKRLMNALAEIKAICAKNDDPEFGCGKKCPFLTGNDGDTYRGCEVMTFTHQDAHYSEVIDTPEEWGEGSGQAIESGKKNYCEPCIHWCNQDCEWEYMYRNDDYVYDCDDYDKGGDKSG